MLYFFSGNDSPFLCIAYALQNDIAQLSSSGVQVEPASGRWLGATQGFPEEIRRVRVLRHRDPGANRVGDCRSRSDWREHVAGPARWGVACPPAQSRPSYAPVPRRGEPRECAFPPDYIIKLGCHCRMSPHDTYSHSSQNAVIGRFIAHLTLQLQADGFRLCRKRKCGGSLEGRVRRNGGCRHLIAVILFIYFFYASPPLLVLINWCNFDISPFFSPVITVFACAGTEWAEMGECPTVWLNNPSPAPTLFPPLFSRWRQKKPKKNPQQNKTKEKPFD